VVQAVKGLGLFSDEYLYKNFYKMNDLEIEEIKNQLEAAAAQAAPPGGAPGETPPPPEGGAPQPEQAQ